MESVRERASVCSPGGESAWHPLTRGIRDGLIPWKIFPLEIIAVAAVGLLAERPREYAEKTHTGEPASR